MAPESLETLLEVLATRHLVTPGEAICPQPAPQANDAVSSPWDVAECRFSNFGGSYYLEIIWARQTASPLRISEPMDMDKPTAAAPPAPTFGVAATYEGQQSATFAEAAPELDQVLEQQAVDLAQGIPVAPPPVAPSLPGYVRARLPLATQQNIARARGGHFVPAAPPMIAPPYVAPVSVPGVPGVPGVAPVAEVAVKPCSAPIPPMPTPGGTPPLARTSAHATVAVSAPVGRAPSGESAPVSNDVSVPRASIVPAPVGGAHATTATQRAGAEQLSAPARDTRPQLHVSTIPVWDRPIFRQSSARSPAAAATAAPTAAAPTAAEPEASADGTS
jgi:hypothetical protein